ncbi:MAG: ribonucleoside-triphosphate reductase [Candidatus Niyogibacteria bacterium]|nr:ribonucleoside-triphosphate reductase [Candidatus Niyogibacteria bacterium]
MAQSAVTKAKAHPPAGGLPTIAPPAGGLTQVKKRDGRIVSFDASRITHAILLAMEATKEGDLKNDPMRVSEAVVRELQKKYALGGTPDIEAIQDIVEEQLILMDFPKVAKAYILYRQKRAEVRAKAQKVPTVIRKLVRESKKYFKNPLSEFIYYRSYSRWIDSQNRRETWLESVGRYMEFMKENLSADLKDDEYEELRAAILKQEVMPSMRLLWSAGHAARVTNVAAYNCSFVAPSRIEDFAEIMYLSMCGTGVGFSVESQTAQQLPQIKMQSGEKIPAYTIEDSKEGWANALTYGLKTWYSGKDVDFDFSKLRPEGARLKTMGGKASGPGPLRDLLTFSRRKILTRQGKRLSNLDVHDIICKIGDIVVSGGVRRSALISLSDLDDIEMRHAKDGQFYIKDPQRSLANNSAVYTEKPSTIQFMEEWLALARSGSGERGIFNRGGLKHQVPARRWKILKHMMIPPGPPPGTNPCGEIILQSKQFCNLTEVVARAEDTEETLLRKMRLATILGTYQATLTNFPYLSRDWARNCNEERLLGVSITGQWDCPAVRNPQTLKRMREESIRVNKEYAARFGIAPSTSITCVKPSGTVSQLVDSSSGMHPRHSKYYIRRVRISATDSLFHMLKDQKVPYKPEVGQAIGAANTYVIEFPVKAPETSTTFRDDLSALQQLEYWKNVKENYTEHNPSVTVSVGDNEWLDVAHWLYANWDMIGGLSFLPREDTVYQLAPYEEIGEEQYKKMKENFPDIDFSQIVLYEKNDETEGAKELACVSGVCEI